MPSILMILGFLLLVFAWILLGHLLWVGFAGVFKSFFGEPDTTKIRVEPPKIFTREDDLQTAATIVNRLGRGKALEAEDYQAIRDRLEKAADRWVVPIENRIILPNVRQATVESSSSQVPMALPATLSTVSATEPPPILLQSEHFVPSEQVEAIEAAKVMVPLHPLAQSYEKDIPEGAAAKRNQRAIGEMLGQFLSEKNIQWGELFSAVLIVGSAIGLILSLRSQLNQIIPMFPVVLFGLFTIAIHLAGFYTLNRWKLPSTSRGLLWIGTLMIAVTGLAACFLAEHQGKAPLTELSFLIPVLLGGLLFSYLSFVSGKSLLPGQPWVWTLAAIPPTFTLAIINRTTDATASPTLLTGLSLMAWSNLVAIGAQLIGKAYLRPGDSLTKETAEADGIGGSNDRVSMQPITELTAELRLVGTAMLTSFLASAFLWFRGRDAIANALPFAIPSAVIGGLFTLLGYYFVLRSKTFTPLVRAQHRRLLESTELIGTAVQWLGLLGLLASMLFAAPKPSLVCWLGIANATALVAWAGKRREPIWTAIAASFLSAVGWFVLQSQLAPPMAEGVTIEWLVSRLPLLSTVYYGLFASIGMGLVGVSIARQEQGHAKTVWSHSLSLQLVSGLLGLASICIVAYLGATASSNVILYQVMGILTLFILAILVVAKRVPNPTFGLFLGLFAGGLTMFVCFVAIQPGCLFDVCMSNRFISDWHRFASMMGMHSLASLLFAIGLRCVPSSSEPTNRSLDVASVIAWLGVGSATASAVGFASWFSTPWPTGEYCGLFLAGSLFLIVQRWNLHAVPKHANLYSLAIPTLAIAIAKWLAAVAPQVSFFLMPSDHLMGWLAVMLGILALVACWVARGQRRPWWIVGVILLLIYQQLYTWLAIPFPSITSGDLLLPFVIPFAFFLLWSVWLDRTYRVLAAIASVQATTAILFYLFPFGRDGESLLYCILNVPMAIGCVTALVDVKNSLRSSSVDSKPKPTFELFLQSAATMVIGGIFILQYAETVEVFSSAARGLASPAGALLGTLYLILATARFLIEPRLGALPLYIATLLLSLHAPMVHRQLESVQWYYTTFTLILLVTMVVHAGLVLVTVTRGEKGVRWLQRFLGQVLAERIRPSKSNFITMALLATGKVILITLILVFFWYAQIDVRIMSLIIAIAASCMWLVSSSTERSPAWRSNLRLSSLALWSLFVVLLTWSSIQAGSIEELWQNRLLRLSTVLVSSAMVVTAAGFYIQRQRSIRALDRIQLGLEPEELEGTSEKWRRLLRMLWLGLSSVAVLMVIMTLCVLGWSASSNGYPIFQSEAIALACALVGWVVVLVVDAVHRFGNIADWEYSQRQRYVYLAQVVVGLVGIECAIVFPTWFRWQIREYWPLIALGLAVVVQFVAKILKDRKIETLGQPLENASLLTPVIVALALMPFSTPLDAEFVLALVSLYYFVLSATKSSGRLALLGGTFANLALMLFWRRFPSLEFVDHPQLWLIPPALSFLIASHLQKRTLSSETTLAIRYLSLAMIFFSSTAEIVLRGFGTSLWPPMVLMVLSVTVALAGMTIQVRSYLYTGFTFLLMAIVSMVAHARQAVEHTWPWWALAISLGIGIWGLFAYFEKNKEKFQHLSDRLRRWEG